MKTIIDDQIKITDVKQLPLISLKSITNITTEPFKEWCYLFNLVDRNEPIRLDGSFLNDLIYNEALKHLGYTPFLEQNFDNVFVNDIWKNQVFKNDKNEYALFLPLNLDSFKRVFDELMVPMLDVKNFYKVFFINEATNPKKFIFSKELLFQIHALMHILKIKTIKIFVLIFTLDDYLLKTKTDIKRNENLFIEDMHYEPVFDEIIKNANNWINTYVLTGISPKMRGIDFEWFKSQYAAKIAKKV